MKKAQIHIVVATLIMTVTFAAGITLPGGFESDPDSSNQGMAILIRKTAFRAFVVSDAIAFTCSAVPIFIYFLMADVSTEPQSKKIVPKLYVLSGTFQCFSMLAVVIAFAMGSLDCASEPGGREGQYRCIGFVRQVIAITPALLCCKNKKNETALHLAANKGHKDVVEVLLRGIDVAEQAMGINTETLMRMTDDGGDTALHKAVRTGCVDTVRLLVEQDPDFEFPANNAGESPLYLAAESGLVKCLSEILEHCNRPTYCGPCGRTALHAAIIQKHLDCAASLWEWNKSLCEETDKWDWNPLHYAVKQGLRVVVRKMLGWKTLLAYTHAGNGNDWATSIHIAANEGRVNMIRELLFHCPDSLEMLDSNGQNALHVAISNYKTGVVTF
ncbi:putative ankyrin repeat-containing protein-like [Capsicum annuum]|nr:putative ankyrin repeat-containing protein-like [Capsicum annuum]KAF3655306.1 putative ankyrin repeat-containing protein-like [Capsicum annuum]